MRCADKACQQLSAFGSVGIGGGGKEVGEPGGSGEFGHSEVGNIEQECVKHSNRIGHANGVHPPDDVNCGGKKRDQYSAIASPITRYAVTSAHRLPYLVEMLPCRPDRPYYEQYHSAVAFDLDDLFGSGLLARHADREARPVHHAQFQGGEKSDKPETEQNIEIAEVGESYDRRQNANGDERVAFGYLYLFASDAAIDAQRR